MSGRPVDVAVWIGLVAAAPFFAILLTCYVKVAVVLSVLRGALGGAIPPRSVTVAVAVLLSGFVMAPVVERAVRAAGPGFSRGDAASVGEAVAAAGEPVREFLQAHTPERERKSFLELARRLRQPAEREGIGERDLVVLAPAFVVAELRAAFQIGFLIFLPFLVLELVIATLLAALGMHGLDARAVSLPFKLLLFVLADGWHLLGRGLILGYL